MAFDIESLGGGAGAGLIGAILGIFGINKKVDGKQDIKVCDVIHKSIDDKFTVLIEGQGKLFNKIDSINEYLRNGK